MKNAPVQTANEGAPDPANSTINRAAVKRFPAFGKQLLQERMEGKIPDNSVAVVFDWSMGRKFPRIVLADDIAPSELEFRFLAGLDVMIAFHEKDADRVPGLLDEILAANPRSILTFAIHLEKYFIVKNLAGEVKL